VSQQNDFLFFLIAESLIGIDDEIQEFFGRYLIDSDTYCFLHEFVLSFEDTFRDDNGKLKIPRELVDKVKSKGRK
jgi:hypothetical protein